MVHRKASPLQAVLGAEVARTYRDLHAEHGVTLVADASVEAFRGDTTVEEVVTDRGTRIAADLVVVGVGAAPRDELAIGAGLTVADGVAVDHHLRTSDDNIFAAGDVAAAFHPHYGTRLRVEHWANALNQGIVAGSNLAGGDQVYDRLPYFFSDQYDLGMEYVGHARHWDRVVLRGSPAERKFIAFWVADERVVAAMSVNTWDVIEPIRHLIQARIPVADSRLRDVDVEIEKLGSAAGLSVIAGDTRTAALPPAPDRYPPIADYALISDCQSAALVSRDGSIDWCCFERFDARPVFARQLDWDRGGYFRVAPTEAYTVVRRYLPSTNVLETRFTTATGACWCSPTASHAITTTSAARVSCCGSFAASADRCVSPSTSGLASTTAARSPGSRCRTTATASSTAVPTGSSSRRTCP